MRVSLSEPSGPLYTTAVDCFYDLSGYDPIRLLSGVQFVDPVICELVSALVA